MTHPCDVRLTPKAKRILFLARLGYDQYGRPIQYKYEFKNDAEKFREMLSYDPRDGLKILVITLTEARNIYTSGRLCIM